MLLLLLLRLLRLLLLLVPLPRLMVEVVVVKPIWNGGSLLLACSCRLKCPDPICYVPVKHTCAQTHNLTLTHTHTHTRSHSHRRCEMKFSQCSEAKSN